MCGGPQWKREIVPDHKFDFVDVREFEDKGFGMRMKYLWLYVLVLKSFLVYVSDIFTAVTMLTTSSWSNQIFNDCPQLEGCVAIPFTVGKWLFVGCIIFSFLLLAYESRKAKKIIASHDISYAFTNIMANHYYSLRSYPHFCFFDHISSSTKRSDDFAFFIFFTFKSWKRLLLADAPRQTINALTLYAIYLSKNGDDSGAWWDVSKYFEGNSIITTCLEISTLFTVLICAGSLLTLLVAGILYIPLLVHIKGNLKEYCCHKVDKRITEIIRRRNKQRLARAASLARKEAAGDYSHLKNKKGQLMQQPLPQPTLPNIDIDEDDKISIRSGRSKGPGSTLAGPDYYGSDAKSIMASEYNAGVPDYSTMPAYAQPYSTHQDPHNPYAHYNPSAPDLGDGYDNGYGSTAYLASGQQAYGQSGDAYGHGQGYVADPYDVYSGSDAHGQQHQQYGYDQQQHGYDQHQHGYEQHYGYDQQQQHYQQQQAGYGGEHLNAAQAAPVYRSPSPSNYGTEPSYHSQAEAHHGTAPAYGQSYAV